ncbi:MAG: protein-export chaperone SecB [Candidatus Cloacimonetes bacterium]|jgi:preprotein translocase subunit SecB|nr:protein-export chaperone SecB [Candidatus Cloacimonadota bacterium]MDY0337131.1 protein-export chaperone SecB [Candidatus Cloacimonadaceae bacterium]MCK9335881.1 protein-export chaperone SecB [Candidatus Cloacimonadota bacterium]MDD2544118.1 protein-export chaperone SecB [Candidatus Cloacimonadota bacterium]MDD2682991.1 protein-export chaperone SecB [Candidatus Cloacimonadota bacterium]
MDKQQQPGIIVKAIYQHKCSFERKQGYKGPITSNFAFRYGYKILDDGCGMAELTLSAKGISKDTQVAVYESEITFIGVFSCLEGAKNMSVEDFLANNAPALLMPYIRESLSGLSAKAGLPAVYLPPINIMALMSQQALEKKEEPTVTKTKKSSKLASE